MNGHLNDEQWAAAVLNQNDAAAANHLAECPACREEVNCFAAAAGAARAQARKVMDQPETFWRRQRERISNRQAGLDFAYPWRRWIWVTATVMLILLASTLLSRNSAPPIQTAAQTDPDDALLLSVQRSIQSDLPRALRPAALLTQEINRAEAARRNP
jgi:predicted anti-sigma-YlaC factor YlaD